MENQQEHTAPRLFISNHINPPRAIPFLLRSVSSPPNLYPAAETEFSMILDDPFTRFIMRGPFLIPENESIWAENLNPNPPPMATYGFSTLGGGLGGGGGGGGAYPPNAHLLDVRLDIPEGDERIIQMFERLLEKKSSKWDYLKMSKPVQVIATQAIGGVLAYAITDSSYPLWAKCAVGGGAVCGIGFIGLAGSGMSSSKKRKMIKAGAITTAWATFVSLGMQLPKLAAWTVGPVAALVTTAAVILA